MRNVCGKEVLALMIVPFFKIKPLIWAIGISAILSGCIISGEVIEDDLEGAKQELLRIQSRFDTMQAAMVGKVGEYEGSMRDLSTEMKALEQVMGKILEPLTSNIKELGRIVEDLRARKK